MQNIVLLFAMKFIWLSLTNKQRNLIKECYFDSYFIRRCHDRSIHRICCRSMFSCQTWCYGSCCTCITISCHKTDDFSRHGWCASSFEDIRAGNNIIFNIEVHVEPGLMVIKFKVWFFTFLNYQLEHITCYIKCLDWMLLEYNKESSF